MTVPGSNLLLRAKRLIRFSTVDYFSFKSRTLNDVRQWIPEFDPSFKLSASVQAVQRDTYTQYGLDFQRNYVRLYAAHNIIDLERDSSGDRFIYNGRLFQLESQFTWWHEDGWDRCLAVEIGKPLNNGPTPRIGVGNAR